MISNLIGVAEVARDHLGIETTPIELDLYDSIARLGIRDLSNFILEETTSLGPSTVFRGENNKGGMLLLAISDRGGILYAQSQDYAVFASHQKGSLGVEFNPHRKGYERLMENYFYLGSSPRAQSPTYRSTHPIALRQLAEGISGLLL